MNLWLFYDYFFNISIDVIANIVLFGYTFVINLVSKIYFLTVQSMNLWFHDCNTINSDLWCPLFFVFLTLLRSESIIIHVLICRRWVLHFTLSDCFDMVLIPLMEFI